MNNYQTVILSPNFSFDLSNSREEIQLSDVILAQVEAVWQREKQKRGDHLFNGKVLSLIEFNHERLLAKFIEYKYFLAYVQEPSLRDALKIKPLSLSCITRKSDAILFGLRSKNVMQYPLHYELAPSGGIDAESAWGEHIDVIGQAKRELEEETGYSEMDINRITPLALIFDKSVGIYEICIEIIIKEECRKLLPSSLEYEELIWVCLRDQKMFIDQHNDIIVPMSMNLLKLFQ